MVKSRFGLLLQTTRRSRRALSRPKASLCALAWAAIVALQAPAAQAQATWKGEGVGFFANDWINEFNWIGNTPPDHATGYIPLAIFFVGPLYQGGSVSNLDSFFGSYTAAGLRFNLQPDPVLAPGVPTSFALTATPGVFLTVNGGPLGLLNNVLNTSTSDILIALNFGGTADVYQRGPGVLTLTGSNSYRSTFLDRGVLSVSSDANLGQTAGVVQFAQTPVLRNTATMTSAVRDFNLRLNPAYTEANAMSFEVAAGTRYTLGAGGNGGALLNTIALAGDFVKRGDGTLALASVGNSFYGRTVVELGTLEFANNAARNTALRSMPVRLQPDGQLRGGGFAVDSDLRLGELTSAGGQLASALGSGIRISALADAEAAAVVRVDRGLVVSGTAEQTLSGDFFSQGDGGYVQVNTGATLRLKSLASASSAGALVLAGGTAIADDTKGALPRLGMTQGVQLGGGELRSQQGLQAMSFLTLQSGATRLVTQDGGAFSFADLARNAAAAGTIDFNGNASANPLALFNGIIGNGWATYKGQDWATQTAGGLVVALPAGAYTPLVGLLPASVAPYSQNALVTGSAQLTLLGGAQYHTLKLDPSGPGLSLDIITPYINATLGNLSTNAVLLAGDHDYTIQNTTPNGTGVLSAPGGAGDLIINVAGAERTLTVKTDLQARRVVKAGAGLLNLDRTLFGPASTFAGGSIEFRINEGTLRGVADGNALYPTTLPLARSSFSLRGGQLEFFGAGAGPAVNLGIGQGPGTVNWASGELDLGSGGFAARLLPLAINLSGPAIWGQGSFVQDGQRLVLGSATANAALSLNFNDGLSLGADTVAYELREIRVVDDTSDKRAVASISGGISGNPWKDLLKTGNGTLVLGANSYQGGTMIAEGTVVALDAKSLGSGPIAGTTAAPYVLLGARSGVEPAALYVGASGVTIARDISVQDGGQGRKVLGSTVAGNTGFSGRILMRGDLTLDVRDAAGVLTFAGPGSELTGQGKLTKTGAGTASFLNANSYSGDTEVQAGRLQINNTTGSATGRGNVTVDGGAILGGEGRVGGALTVRPGGLVAPGNSPGTLTVGGSATFAYLSGLEWELAAVGRPAAAGTGLSALTGHDLLYGESSIDFSGAVVLAVGLAGFDAGFSPNLPYSWLVAHADLSITGVPRLNLTQFAPAGATGNFSLNVVDRNLYLDYAPVPEPATQALMLLGLLGVVFGAVRRRAAGL